MIWQHLIQLCGAASVHGSGGLAPELCHVWPPRTKTSQFPGLPQINKVSHNGFLIVSNTELILLCL